MSCFGNSSTNDRQNRILFSDIDFEIRERNHKYLRCLIDLLLHFSTDCTK